MSEKPESYASDLVFINSPLNLLAKFTAYLQARFSQGKLPWEYSDNEAESGIFIFTEYSLPKDASNLSPAIVVGRGSTVHNRDVVADRDQESAAELFKGGQNSWGTGEMDVRIQCIGQTYGESSIIGDVVQASISMAIRALTELFTLRNISPVVLGPTMPYERDEDKFVSNVDFRVFFEQRWFVIQAAPELQGIDVSSRLNEEAAEHVKTFTLIPK